MYTIINIGDYMEIRRLNGKDIQEIIIEANPERGFNFPFTLLVPVDLCDDYYMIYKCNLPKNYIKGSNSLEEIQKKTLEDKGNIDPIDKHFLCELDFPLLLPAIPRGYEWRPNFLGKDFIHGINFKDERDDILDKDKYVGLPEQIKNMIQYGLEILNEMKPTIHNKAIITGYSEGAKCASHFALLHPETIEAVVAGGTGGAMSMPIKEKDGYEFIYPTGIADLPYFDEEEYRKIAFFYYMGDKDVTDSAAPYFDDVHYIDENGEDRILCDVNGNHIPAVDEYGRQVFKLDENGNYKAKYSLFTDSEVNAICKVFGAETQDRFVNQSNQLKELGLNVMCKKYPGDHHTVFDSKEEIKKDIDNFLGEVLNKTSGKQMK